MENWQLWAAIYISGVFTAMYALWLPSWRVIKKIQPDNIIIRRPILSNIVVFWIFFLFFPVTILSIIIPSKTENFIKGFIEGATNLPKE